MENNNNSVAKAIVIIMAVACIALMTIFIVKSVKSVGDTSADQSDIAGYGMEETTDEGGEEIVTSNGDSYVTTDDSTEEMDSIPNEAEAPPVEGDDAGTADEG